MPTRPALPPRPPRPTPERASDARAPSAGPMTWADVVAHPALQDLPFKIEQDRHGRLVMSPTDYRHGKRQSHLFRLLDALPGGEAMVECALETAEGVKVADVVWMSDAFAERVPPDTFALPSAPEICAEVMSPSNAWAEMAEKVLLYLARGAQEVWIVEADGRLRVFGHDGERAASVLAPDAPSAIP